MPSNMISPLLWKSISPRDPDSFTDFLFQHEQWHRELARVTRTRFIVLDDLKTNLFPHAQMHIDLAKATSVPQITDLLSYDLEDPASFVNFMTLNADDHQRFRSLTGL